jgi:hypothetical protein
MKFAKSFVSFVAVALTTIPSAFADFHIVQGIAPGGGAGLEACPSDYYNCKCLKDGDRAAQVIVNGAGVGSLPANFFSVKKGLCGLGQLNFYKSSDGKSWNFYQDKGDGTVQGTCYPNTAGTTCSGFIFNDQLVCYSYICK